MTTPFPRDNPLTTELTIAVGKNEKLNAIRILFDIRADRSRSRVSSSWLPLTTINTHSRLMRYCVKHRPKYKIITKIPVIVKKIFNNCGKTIYARKATAVEVTHNTERRSDIVFPDSGNR